MNSLILNRKNCIVLFVLVLWICFAGMSFANASYDLYVGDSIELSSYVAGEGQIGELKDIKWTTNDSKIATVSSTGKITGVKKGTTFIKVASNDGTHAKEILIDITVKSMVKKVTITTDNADVRVGELKNLSYELVPITGVVKIIKDGVTWKSTDTSIVSVSGDGEIKGVKAGSAVILVKSKDSNFSDSIQVKITSTVERVKFAEYEETLSVGEEYRLKPMVLPETAYLKDLVYKSWDTSIVTVDKDGIVTAVKAGEVIVEAKSVDGEKKGFKNIIVRSMVRDVALNENRVELNEDRKTFLLTTRVIPKYDASKIVEKGLTWKSSNSAIAKVDAYGLVTALKDGVCKITVTTKDGGHEDYCSIIVDVDDPVVKKVPKVTSIEFIDMPSEAKVGEKIRLKLKIFPMSLSEEVTFNANVGGSDQFEKIDDIWYFTPKRNLVYKITAKSKDGNVKDSIDISCTSMVHSVDIEVEDLVKENGKYIAYLGQQVIAEYTLHPNGNYKTSEILMQSAIWAKGSKSEMKVEAGGHFTGYVDQLNNIMLDIETDDNARKDEVYFKIEPMTESIKLDKQATIGLYDKYTPKVTFTPYDDLRYGYKDVINKEFTVYLNKTYISKQYLEVEKEYEEKIVADFNKRVVSENDKEVKNKMIEDSLKHLTRLSSIKFFLSQSNGNYCLLDNDKDYSMTDRNGSALKVAKLSKNEIEGFIQGKVNLRVVSKDGTKFDYMDVYIDAEATDLIIVDKDGKIVSASDRKALDSIEEQKQKEYDQKLADEKLKTEDEKKLEAEKLQKKKALADLYFSTKEHKPSAWATLTVYDAASTKLLTDRVQNDYIANISREEFAELLIKLYSKLTNKVIKNYGDSPFIDTDNASVVVAYNLGIVNGVGNRRFAPNDNITRQEMCVMIFNTLDATGKKLNSTERVTSIFADEDLISDWAKKSIKYLSKDHNLITGIGNNKLGVLDSATKEESIAIVLKVYKNLME